MVLKWRQNGVEMALNWPEWSGSARPEHRVTVVDGFVAAPIEEAAQEDGGHLANPIKDTLAGSVR